MPPTRSSSSTSRPPATPVRCATSVRWSAPSQAHAGSDPASSSGRLSLGAIRTPTLYLYGTDDPVADVAIVERIVSALPGAALHLLEGTGHVTWLDDPPKVGEHIRRFLAES